MFVEELFAKGGAGPLAAPPPDDRPWGGAVGGQKTFLGQKEQQKFRKSHKISLKIPFKARVSLSRASYNENEKKTAPTISLRG